MPNPQQSRLDALFRHTADLARELAADAHAGRITPREFGNSMAALLEEAHASAVLIARHAAGDNAPLDADDREFAALVVDGETEFLAGFVADLRGGRYSESIDALTLRAASYAGRLVGTANEVFALASGPEELWAWELGATEHSCPDCPRIASGGPYRRNELPTTPGAGGTACLGNCRCRIVRADGTEGFRVPETI